MVTAYIQQTGSGATYPFAAVPEPSTLLLLVMGLLGVARLRKAVAEPPESRRIRDKSGRV